MTHTDKSPRSPVARERLTLWWLALLGATAGGLGELLARITLRRVSAAIDRTFYLDPQAIWMAPLANLPIFLVAVGVVSVCVRREPARTRWAIAAVVALDALEVALITRRVAELALLVLALGLGVQLSWLAMRLGRSLPRLVRGTAITLSAVSIVGGLAWNVRDRLLERQHIAQLPDISSNAPSVLLLVLDTVRAWDLSLYGYHLRTTPTLERLAAEGILFEHAVSTAPWTLPSHASIFTGRYPHDLSTGWYSPLDDQHRTLAERMSASGYATGGFVGNLIYTSHLYGLNRGFMRYRDYPIDVAQAVTATTLGRWLQTRWNRRTGHLRDTQHRNGGLVTDEFLAWQATLGRRPFFAFLNYFDAHDPYQPPAPFDTLFLGREPRLRRVTSEYLSDPDTVGDLHLAYNGAIRYADSEIDRLLGELGRRGVLDNTLVIVTADHGEAFGEHGPLGHGSTLYLPQTHVPLLVLLPGRAVRGVTVRDPVSLRDLAATILDVAHARAAGLPGTSLAPLWQQPGDSAARSSRSPVITEVQQTSEYDPRDPVYQGDMRAIVFGGWHYIEHQHGEPELYRISTDSLERTNLAGDASQDSILQALHALLERNR